MWPEGVEAVVVVSPTHRAARDGRGRRRESAGSLAQERHSGRSRRSSTATPFPSRTTSGMGRRARCAIDTRAADLIEIARRHRYGHKERIAISTASPSASAFESVALSPSEQCRPDGPFRAGAIASASAIHTFGESKAGAHRGIRGRRPLLVARSLSTHACAVACVRARRSFECDSRAG
jgi:hypothetical protein